jgi:hypothetical protein
MSTIPKIAAAMRTILTTTANTLALSTRFVQRRSKLDGALFAQTLVFGWWGCPAATLEELADTSAILGCDLTPQALDQRFTERAATFLGQLLAATVHTVVASNPVAIPVLKRFTGVYLTDSSLITLPSSLHTVWRGCGNGAKPVASAVKMLVRFDLLYGTLVGPLLFSGRTHDREAAQQAAQQVEKLETCPKGGLHLADLGFFDLERLQAWSEQEVFWLTRLLASTAVYLLDGTRLRVEQWLCTQRLQPHQQLEMAVQLGVKERLSARLLVQRVPSTVAEVRRRRLRQEARRRGQTVSATRLALADWTLFVTNVPPNRLSVEEALALGRARWQIELLFQRWKSQGRVDEWRSHKPWRIMCEVYAKLIALVMQHWLLVVSCWQWADRSLSKATRLLQRCAEGLMAAFALALTLNTTRPLEGVLGSIQRRLARRCRITRHKRHPSTYQLLLHPSLLALA